MSDLRLTGTNLVNAPDGPVDRYQVDVSGGPARSYYDPNGPNAGLTHPGATVLQWTDTVIDINDPSLNGKTVTDVFVRDVDSDFTVAFILSPPLDVPTLTVTYDDVLDNLVVQSDFPIFADWLAPNQIWADIDGTNTNAAVGLLYVSDTEAYLGTNAAAALGAPTTITQIKIGRSVLYANNDIVGHWEGNVPIPSAGDSGVITSVVQSAFDEITINGYDFLNNTTNPVMQVSVSFSSVPLGNGNILTFYLPGSVNFGSNDPGSGFGPVTDTAIVISNPQIAAANGAVIEDVEAQDDPYTWPTTAVFDVSPDLVMV